MGVRLKISDLRPGMVLSENLTNNEGAIIFPVGKEITEDDIIRLSNILNLNKFVVVEGEDVLRKVLEDTERKADENLKSEVNKALSFCSGTNEELKRDLYLLGLRYRILLADEKKGSEQ